MTLLVSGWVALDDIETPFGAVHATLGGSAPSAALAAALFTNVRLLAAIGRDLPASELAKLEGRNIDLSGVTVEGALTSRWGGRYHYDMNSRDTLFTELGVNADRKPQLVDGWEDSSGAFLAADNPVTQRDVLGALAAPRATMVDTIKFYIDGALDDVKETMRCADFVALNESEAREIGQTASIANAGRRLLEGVGRGVLVKLGEYGAVAVTADDYFVAPGYPLDEVVDPTGAGDAFAGGFMGYLDSVPAISRVEIRRAVLYASVCASFAVEGFGPSRLLTLTRSEVDNRYAEFRRLTHVEGAE